MELGGSSGAAPEPAAQPRAPRLALAQEVEVDEDRRGGKEDAEEEQPEQVKFGALSALAAYAKSSDDDGDGDGDGQ